MCGCVVCVDVAVFNPKRVGRTCLKRQAGQINEVSCRVTDSKLQPSVTDTKSSVTDTKSSVTDTKLQHEGPKSGVKKSSALNLDQPKTL